MREGGRSIARALRLGFDEDDYVIRRRLAQKVEFHGGRRGKRTGAPRRGSAARNTSKNHRENYRQPPNLTLTHVFFDASQRGANQARNAAKQALMQLRAKRVAFNDAAPWGDVFLYHRNYVESSQTDLAGHFGESMAEALFGLESGVWQGPLESPYGLHLVLIANRGAGGLPNFNEVRARVRTDAEQARRKDFTNARIAEIVGAYKVTSDLNGYPDTPSRR